MPLFIKNYPLFIKNTHGLSLKKFQPLISAFIKKNNKNTDFYEKNSQHSLIVERKWFSKKYNSKSWRHLISSILG